MAGRAGADAEWARADWAASIGVIAAVLVVASIIPANAKIRLGVHVVAVTEFCEPGLSKAIFVSHHSPHIEESISGADPALERFDPQKGNSLRTLPNSGSRRDHVVAFEPPLIDREPRKIGTATEFSAHQPRGVASY
jgi:hypothetical protein